MPLRGIARCDGAYFTVCLVISRRDAAPDQFRVHVIQRLARPEPAPDLRIDFPSNGHIESG